MIGVSGFLEVKGRAFGKGKRQKPRQGSRKYVELQDGSIVKWWNGEWRFYKMRLNTGVATSLTTRAMAVAAEKGRMVKDEERFSSFEAFVTRMKPIIGLDALIKVVQWIQG